MKIIDVSKHNGHIDWDKVKADGIDGVIIRAGYGKVASQKDQLFEENYAGAKAAGLLVGTYWYSYALFEAEAIKEANVFLDAIKGKKFELPVYFDIEEKAQAALSKPVCTRIATAFCTTVERAGYWCGVYSYDSFFKTNLETFIQDRFACWVARVENIKPTYCKKYGMHQYSWKGKVDGINGDVDMNDMFIDYPPMIKSNGLNGYSNTPLYKVEAVQTNMSHDAADDLAEKVRMLGMTVLVSEE